MKCVELVMVPAKKANASATTASASPAAAFVLQEVTRDPGSNDIGMVAWKFTLHTPDYPAGKSFFSK